MKAETKRAPASAGSDTNELAPLCHDLNNIAAVLRLLLDLARASSSEAERQRALLCGLACVPRLRQLLDRIEALKNGLPSVPQSGTQNPGAVIHEILEAFSISAPNIRFYYHHRLNLWPLMMGKIELGQVLDNLVKNAIEAMPNGGTIAVMADNVEIGSAMTGNRLMEPGKYVRVTVQDTGKGIPEEMQTRLFQPYASDKETGTGLGLSNVKRIVEECGGRVCYETSQKGTRFNLYLVAS